MLAAKENHKWKIEERSSEVVEALEIVELMEGEPTMVTNVGVSLDPTAKEGIVEFLKRNLDVFVWSHEDMPGILEDVIQHQLDVDPEKKPVQQRRRVFAPKRNQAIMDKVDKLLATKFIWEVYYRNG